MEEIVEKLEAALAICRAVAEDSDESDREALRKIIREIEAAIRLARADC